MERNPYTVIQFEGLLEDYQCAPHGLDTPSRVRWMEGMVERHGDPNTTLSVPCWDPDNPENRIDVWLDRTNLCLRVGSNHKVQNAKIIITLDR